MSLNEAEAELILHKETTTVNNNNENLFFIVKLLQQKFPKFGLCLYYYISISSSTIIWFINIF